jgi:hypothetical protein
MKNFKPSYIALLFITLLAACDEHGDPQGNIVLDDAQKAAVSMRGKWGQASDALLPFGTTPGVLNDLIMVFRIDDDYHPSDFSTDGAPYFFQGEGGTWSWGDESLSLISLGNILPVTQITVMEEGHAIRLSFTYNGPSGGRTSNTGKVGDYGITLRKIAP